LGSASAWLPFPALACGHAPDSPQAFAVVMTQLPPVSCCRACRVGQGPRRRPYGRRGSFLTTSN
jgi:hypothetical protein